MTLSLSSDLEKWFSYYRARLEPSMSCDTDSCVDGVSFIGDSVSLARIELQAIEKLYFRNSDSSFSFCIAELGQFGGLVGDRSIFMTPHRLAFVMLPDETLKLIPRAEVVRFLQVSVDVNLLYRECSLHGNSFPNLLSLNESIPGHEQLIIACAAQLFKFAGSLDISVDRISKPLEASILSLLGTLLSFVPSGQQTNVVDTPSHSSYVDAALTYMEDHISESICLSDLCHVCCVSSRTLQVSFQAVMNRTPIQVLHEMRLARLRDLLLQGFDVGRACQLVGLLHSGRISANYKRLFGELPRQTRNRGSKRVAEPVGS